MSGFLKKLMATGAALTMGLSSVAFANNACCPPPCDPCASWLTDAYVDLSWLYWKPGGDGFNFGVEKTSTCVGGVSIANERERSIDFDWDSGFRLGGGFTIPCLGNGWGVDLSWTSYETKKSKRLALVGLENANVVFGLPSLSGFSDCLEEGETARLCGSARFKYNVVDLEMGKWCCCGNGALMFRPHIGIRFADIEERFNNRIDLSIPFEDVNAARFHAKNRFEGAGIRAGLDVDLPLSFCTEGFSILGRSAISSLWGSSHVNQHIALSSNSFIDNNLDNLRRRDHRPLFIADLTLGVRWKSTLMDCYAFSLELAWENHYLFNQTKFVVENAFNNACEASGSFSRRGDLLLHGLTLTAGFDF